tara:strand:- start:5 stop:829 length:825 start_codon:yes stop_codon:yes gene_type:complete
MARKQGSLLGKLEKLLLGSVFKIITTCYNCEHFIERCIKSMLLQDENEWEMYIIDDASFDKSIEVAQKTANRDPRIKILRNKKNMGAVFNKTSNFVYHAKPVDEDIIVTLDGDDYLTDTEALSYLKEIYLKDYWLSYGGFTGSKHVTYPPDHLSPIDWSLSLRNQRFCITALRSHKFFLYKNIKDKDLRYKNGSFFKFPEDIILNIPMAEMAGQDKCFYIHKKLYYYNLHAGSDHFLNDEHRTNIIAHDLTFRPQYPQKTKEELINHKCDWIHP